MFKIQDSLHFTALQVMMESKRKCKEEGPLQIDGPFSVFLFPAFIIWE